LTALYCPLPCSRPLSSPAAGLGPATCSTQPAIPSLNPQRSSINPQSSNHAFCLGYKADQPFVKSVKLLHTPVSAPRHLGFARAALVAVTSGRPPRSTTLYNHASTHTYAHPPTRPPARRSNPQPTSHRQSTGPLISYKLKPAEGWRVANEASLKTKTIYSSVSYKALKGE